MARFSANAIKRFVLDRLYSVRLYHFRDADGNFDYERYKRVQTEGNKRKLQKTWARDEHIEFLSRYIRSQTEPKFGICHGTRRGFEQERFRHHLGIDVIGTEISETASSFPHTIEWDFHEIKDEWIAAVDFIYTNALDHAYDPKRCVEQWMRCLRRGGLCIIEHSRRHTPASSKPLDPFGVTLPRLIELIDEWGGGSFAVKEILRDFAEDERKTHFIVVANRPPHVS